MLDVVLISKTSVDWETYLLGSKQALGRNITKRMDANNLKRETLLGYLTTVTELESDEVIDCLQHVSISVLVMCSERDIFDIIRCSKLRCKTGQCQANHYLSIVTGDLEDWRSVVIDGCSATSNFSYRLFTTKILGILESLGLTKLFSAFTKVKQTDTTVRLIEKK